MRIWQTDAGNLITDEQLLSALVSRGGLRQAAVAMDARAISGGDSSTCAETDADGATGGHAGETGACADAPAVGSGGLGACARAGGGASSCLKNYLENR